MSRFIDADALIEAMRKYEKEAEEAMTCPSWWSAFNVIEKQPTAYDVEKVVAELEKKMHHSFNQRYKAFAEAIVIVRKGG